MKTLKTLAVIFVLLAAITNLQAQSDKIRIILKQPPPNQMGVGDLWNLELNNTTDKDMKIYLTGTATEEKDGLIIEGKSKVFTIKPGRSTYKYNDFSNAEVKYNNGKYKEIILRTGNAPEGSYTICVTAFDEGGTEVGRENCIMQSVQQMVSITLLTPSDGEEIDPDTLPGLMFSWTPLPKGGPYSIKIVELKGDQSPEVAMKQNRAILEVNDIRTTTHHVAPSQVKVIVMGMKYAWQVTSGNVESEVYKLLIGSGGQSINVEFIPRPCEDCCFDMKIVGNFNPIYNAFRFSNSSTNITSVTPTAGNTVSNQTSTSAVMHSSGFFTPNSIVGTICFDYISGPFLAAVQWSTNAGSIFIHPMDSFSLQCAPPCGGSICDSLSATATLQTSGDCCWEINLTHPVNTTGIKGVQFLALFPNTFVTGSSSLGTSAGTPWLYGPNTLNEFTVKKLTGSVPPGQLNGFFRFCLNKLSNPQYVVINWLGDSNTTVCSDTVALNCDIACVTVNTDTVICNENNYILQYTFTNNATFAIGTIDVVQTIPSGITITPSSVTLSPVVNSNGTSGVQSFTLSGAQPNTSACVIFKFTSPDGCCWCYDTVCVTIPSCICDEIDASLQGDPMNCCYSFNIQNNYSGNYFTQINLTTLQSGVTFSTWNTNTSANWYSWNSSPNTQIQLVNIGTGFVPTGNLSGIVNFCLTGYTSSPQAILVEWMRNDSVKCVDTVFTECPPPPPSTDCVQIINDSLICLPNGDFQYTFYVKNNSSHSTTGFQLNPVSPGTLTFTPSNFSSVPIGPGMTSTQQTLTISGMNPNSQFCFYISLYEHLYQNGQIYYDWCCYSDTICVTTPDCGCDLGAVLDTVICGPMVPYSTGQVQSYNFNITINSPFAGWFQTPTTSYYWYSNSGMTVNPGFNTFNCTFLNTLNLAPGTQVCLTGGVMSSTAPFDTCYFTVCFDIPDCPGGIDSSCLETALDSIWCIKDSSGVKTYGYSIDVTNNSPYNGSYLFTVGCGTFQSPNWGSISSANTVTHNGQFTSTQTGTCCITTELWKQVSPNNIDTCYDTLCFTLPDCSSDTCTVMVTGGPQQGDTLCKGSPVTITWVSTTTGNVNISLINVNSWSVYQTVAVNVPNSGSYSWTLPAGIPCDSIRKWQFYVENVERTCWNYGPVFYINCCDSTDCGCGKWKSTTVGVSVNNKPALKYGCGEQVTAALNSTILINFPGYICYPDSCDAEYKWELSDGSGSIINSGTSNPFNYTFNTAGSYLVSYIAYCDGKPCDTCKFYVNIKGGPTGDCKCNEKAGFHVNYGDGTSGNVSCGETITAAYLSTLVFTPSGLCIPKDCLKNYTYNIYEILSGTPVFGQSMIGNNPFNVTMNSNSGYKIVITYNCGGEKCECVIYVRTKDEHGCECKGWKGNQVMATPLGSTPTTLKCGDTFNTTAPMNVTFNFPSYLCNPSDCNASYQWEVSGSSGNATGSGNSFAYNFTDAGLHTATVYSYCGTHKCDSCTIIVKVDSTSSSCLCTNASLEGVNVATRINSGGVWPTVYRVVGPGIELPSCGTTLGMNSNRWDIDFGSNTIRIDFIESAATYGGGVFFNFSDLVPQGPGCPAGIISGITVTTNHSLTPFNVITAATFTSNSVKVQFAPNSGTINWNPGDYILVKLNYDCP
jgi:hypothetical protein